MGVPLKFIRSYPPKQRQGGEGECFRHKDTWGDKHSWRWVREGTMANAFCSLIGPGEDFVYSEQTGNHRSPVQMSDVT